MNRPAGVVVTVVLQVLGSLFAILMAAFFVVAPLFIPKNTSQPELPSVVFFAMGAFYLLMGLIGLATAVGVYQLRQWARYSTTIFAGILGALCLIMAAAFAFVPVPPPPSQPGAELPAHFGVIFKLIMVGTQLALVALAGWWIYYFNRADIKLRFEGGAAGTSTLMSRRPLSIAILAIFNLVGSAMLLALMWSAPPVAFLGIILRGSASRFFYVVSALLGFYVGVGLWRLMPASRIVAIACQLFYFVNAILLYALPGRVERSQRLMAEASRMWHFANVQQSTQSFTFGAWLGIAGVGICAATTIYFLVTRRYAFEPVAAPPAVPVA